MSFPPGYVQQDDSRSLYGTAVAFIILEIIFVGLRFYSRYSTKAKLGIDDFLMIPALVFAVGAAAICITMINYGAAGHHTDYIIATQPEKLVTFNKIQFALIVDYLLAVAFPKLAILALMIRIFPQGPFRLSCFAIAGIITAAAFTNIVVACLLCRPINAIWDLDVPDAKCLDINGFFRWAALPNWVTDVIILILPIPVIAKLSLSTGMKIGLIITFSAGGISLVVSILRFQIFFRVNQTTDILYRAGTVGIYTIVETGGYTIAASLVMFRHLVHRASEKLTSQNYGLSSSIVRAMPWSKSSKLSSTGDVKTSQSSKSGTRADRHQQWYGDTLPLTSLESQRRHSPNGLQMLEDSEH